MKKSKIIAPVILGSLVPAAAGAADLRELFLAGEAVVVNEENANQLSLDFSAIK
jgi:hypothetical protein